MKKSRCHISLAKIAIRVDRTILEVEYSVGQNFGSSASGQLCPTYQRDDINIDLSLTQSMLARSQRQKWNTPNVINVHQEKGNLNDTSRNVFLDVIYVHREKHMIPTYFIHQDKFIF